jgi:SH3-like domain-containing protein
VAVTPFSPLAAMPNGFCVWEGLLMMRRNAVLAGVLAFAFFALPAGAQSGDSPAPAAGPLSGLPVPRFVSLNADEANGRRRPDANAPIDWVYIARDLPLRVVAESGPWRRVEDPEGGTVWMHADNLANNPTVYVRGAARPEAILRAHPRRDARTVAILEVGVIGRVTDCQDGWVRIGVGEHRGWVREDALWGAVACPS